MVTSFNNHPYISCSPTPVGTNFTAGMVVEVFQTIETLAMTNAEEEEERPTGYQEQ